MIFMSFPARLRPSEDIHGFLVEQLNQTLRRPGMYGGEAAVRLVIDHLAYVERSEAAVAGHYEAMESCGSFIVTGATEAFSRLIPDSNEYGMASVYAEFAREREWLWMERLLSADDYATMAGMVEPWLKEDRMLSDVLGVFGEPSIFFGGSNPRYGKTLAYASVAPDDPMVFFHLWNGSDPETGAPWPAYDEPVLFAVRRGSGRFDQRFTFTPKGERLRLALA
ncbi:hypothetical protein [Nonomuraea glycinis]|uniref:hypothetical protein n=1 Tax=Nonomuraea glycinis TaxID=2047744 RepID=UPI002E121374|nr:hypothetical protein OHA68_21285 [Nonomuraea glycinis]